jgi:hypothetical protein
VRTRETSSGTSRSRVAEDDQQRGEREDENALGQRGTDEPGQHQCAVPNSVPNSSAAPSVTTSAPRQAARQQRAVIRDAATSIR